MTFWIYQGKMATVYCRGRWIYECTPYMGALAATGTAHGLCVATLATRHAARRCASNGGFLNGRARQLGPFLTASAHQLWAFVHYSSSTVVFCM